MMFMIRGVMYSGSFYPSDSKEIKIMIDDFFSRVDVVKNYSGLKGIIVPHAGYVYSGLVASVSYKILMGFLKDKKDVRVVVIGPSHNFYLSTCVLDTYSAWETPFGLVHVDVNLREFLKEKGFKVWNEVHEKEHSIEVQMPFLKYVFERINKDFSFLPVCVNKLDVDKIRYFAKVLSDLDNVVFVVSSDLSHYLAYDDAVKKDSETIKNIISLNVEKELDACGESAIKIIMEMARIKGWNIELALYLNSGDITKDYDAVVGYSSMVVYEP